MSAMQAISKAAESAGQKAPVTANKSLTTMQDFHTSMGDSMRQRAARDKELMDSFNYKYDKGQRVFTEDSAQMNHPPMTVLSRALEGNRMMRENPDDILSKKIIDELTGKPKRTPPEPGYRVRLEHSPDNWSEFLIPESAIKGSVDKAKGGAIRMQVGGLGTLAKFAKSVMGKKRPTPPVTQGVEGLLPLAEREANKVKFMQESTDPRRFYHGTKADIPSFIPSGRGGTFVSPEPSFASKFAGQTNGVNGNPNVMPVRVQVKNPFDYDNPTHIDAITEAAKAKYGHSKFQLERVLDEIKFMTRNDEVSGTNNNWASVENPDVQRLIKDLGHDAYYTSEFGVKNLGVYDPKRIKSDIGNKGTYNVNEADINEAKGGAIRMQVGGLSALANAGKAGTLANRLSRAESAGMRARQFADPLNPDDIMRMSEALGYAGAEGKTLNLTQADRSRVFGPNKGGTGFSGLQLTSPEHKKAKSTWGVGKPSHLTRLTNATNDDAIWSTFIGSPTQHMSNPVTVERMYEAHKKGNPSAKLIGDMNQMLNKAVDNKTGKPMFPNGIDISDPSSLNQAQTFNQRKLLAKAMVMGGEKKGEKATQEAFKIIKEETDPLLTEAPTYAVGNRLFTIDKNSGLYRPDLNSAFPRITTGDDFGLLFEPAPIELAARDFAALYKGRLDKNGRPMPLGHKDLSSTTPKQFIDDKYLTNLQKEGYQDGGSVNQTFTQRLQSAMGQHMAGGGEVVDNTTTDMTNNGSVNSSQFFDKGGMAQISVRSLRGLKPRKYAEAGSVLPPTPQEIEQMAGAQKAAFGVFPQMASQSWQQQSPFADKASEMLKAQVTKEWEQAGRPGGTKELSLRISAVLAGQVPDFVNFGQSMIPGLNKPASVLDPEGEKVARFPMSGTSTDIKNSMRDKGIINEDEYPLAELAGVFGAPYAAVKAPKAIKGGLNMVKPVVKEAGDMASRAVVPMRRQFEPSTFTIESTADDLGQNTSYGFRQGVNDVLLGNPNLGTGKNKSREAVGTFMNPNKLINPKGLTEINPMMAIDVRGAGTIGNVPSANKALRKQVGQLGEDLNQTSMAGHRFIPLMTNNIKDASSMLIKTPQGLNKDEIKQLAVLLGDDMVLAHNPRLGGVVVMPFGRVEKGQIPEEFLKAQSAANEVLGKRGKVQFGVSDFDKDRLFMEKTKGDYVQAGANQMSKEQQAQREKLQGLEKFLFPQSRSGIPGQVKAAPVGGLQPWSVGSDYPTSVIGIGNGSRVQYQPRNFSTGKEGSRYDTYMDAERERAQMLDEFHRTLVPKYR